jgi:hypothetical protein
MTDSVFDINKLSAEELGHMEYIVNSPSWERVFRPFFIRARDTYTELLLHRDPKVRIAHGGSPSLRAAANNMSLVVTFFDKIIEETQHERAIAAASGTPDYAADTEF